MNWDLPSKAIEWRQRGVHRDEQAYPSGPKDVDSSPPCVSSLSQSGDSPSLPAQHWGCMHALNGASRIAQEDACMHTLRIARARGAGYMQQHHQQQHRACRARDVSASFRVSRYQNLESSSSNANGTCCTLLSHASLSRPIDAVLLHTEFRSSLYFRFPVASKPPLRSLSLCASYQFFMHSTEDSHLPTSGTITGDIYFRISVLLTNFSD